jgi:hypothetical protein
MLYRTEGQETSDVLAWTIFYGYFVGRAQVL